jgi:xylose dehydrogenase (NAD/NADP)
MYRHHPQMKCLLELVEAGTIGEPRLVRAKFSYVMAPGENVRLEAALDGGSLMDVGCYGVHASRQLLGEPERLHGEQVLGEDGIDVRFGAVMRFPGDRLALVDCGFDLCAQDELEVVGEEGVLFVDDPWHSVEAGIELRRESGTERIEIPAKNPYAAELENLAAAIRGEAPPLIGRDDALGQARALQALYAAAA